jgi:hypothetical protein
MRRAQRIVQLEGEVVLRAIEWREAVAEAAARATDGSMIRADSMADRLDESVGRLVDELERLAVPS